MAYPALITQIPEGLRTRRQFHGALLNAIQNVYAAGSQEREDALCALAIVRRSTTSELNTGTAAHTPCPVQQNVISAARSYVTTLSESERDRDLLPQRPMKPSRDVSLHALHQA